MVARRRGMEETHSVEGGEDGKDAEEQEILLPHGLPLLGCGNCREEEGQFALAGVVRTQFCEERLLGLAAMDVFAEHGLEPSLDPQIIDALLHRRQSSAPSLRPTRARCQCQPCRRGRVPLQCVIVLKLALVGLRAP